MNLTAKRMKVIFKKYIDFEKLNGTEATHERAVQMARKYIDNKEEALKMAMQSSASDDNAMDLDNNDDDDVDMDESVTQAKNLKYGPNDLEKNLKNLIK